MGVEIEVQLKHRGCRPKHIDEKSIQHTSWQDPSVFSCKGYLCTKCSSNDPGHCHFRDKPCCLLLIPFHRYRNHEPHADLKENQCIYHSTRRLNQPLLQVPGLAEKQGRNWMGYNIQIHFTTRNRRDSVCNRKEDREKCIFTGYRIVWVGKGLWRPSSPTPPPLT